ncbi:MAG: L,D-transpeptidase family protein [Candidatus Saccharibacteria bacterium]|nr:L,D-transpeptidase family protein [Candidatus Saccharibacteria bacterium]
MNKKWKFVVLGLEVIALIGLTVALIAFLRSEKKASQPVQVEIKDVDEMLVEEASTVEALTEIVDDLTAVQTVQAAELQTGTIGAGTIAVEMAEVSAEPQAVELPYLVDATPFVYCDVNAGLNLREGPSTESKKLTTLHRGAAAAVIGEENGWYHVIYNGIEGYLDKNYVSNAIQSEYRFVVNRTEQMFRIYNNRTGEVLYEIPCITGRHETQYETPTGIFCVYYMQKNAHLRKYNVDVYYWVAINGGIGIHDARWRTEDEFTPDRYGYDGSHGCINITVANMPTIYNLIQKGNIVEIVE